MSAHSNKNPNHIPNKLLKTDLRVDEWAPEPTSKICGLCKIDKQIQEFRIKRVKRNGNNSYYYCCKKCYNEKQNERNRIAQNLKKQQKELDKPKPKDGHKFCSKCKVDSPKTLEFFNPHRGAPDGLGSKCKPCAKKFNRIISGPNKFQYSLKEGHKICRRCDQELPLEKFRIIKRKQNNYKPQHESYCLECEAKSAAIRYRDNPEKEKEKRDKHRALHKDEINANAKKRYHANPEYYRAKGREKSKAPGRREKNNKWRKEKQKNDPVFKLSCVLRSRTFKAIKDKRFTKNKQLFEYFGCSMEEYIKYVESLWHPGMSWDNYGKAPDQWSIDHINPLVNANTEEEVYQLCHYLNTKPMWAIYNYIKNDKSPSEWAAYKLQHNIDESLPPVTPNPQDASLREHKA